MRLNAHKNIEIAALRAAGGAAFWRRVPLAGEANAGAVFNARRNRHIQLCFLARLPRPVARCAGIRDIFALAAAGRAGALHCEKALLGSHAALARAGGAGLNACARLRANTVAALTILGNRDRDINVLARKGFLEADLEFIAQIGAPRRCLALPPPAAAKHIGKSAACRAAAKDLAENIVEILEACAAARAALFKGRMSHAVIGCAFLLIR